MTMKLVIVSVCALLVWGASAQQTYQLDEAFFTDVQPSADTHSQSVRFSFRPLSHADPTGVKSGGPTQKKEWSLSTYPSPFLDPTSCNRGEAAEAGETTWLCDPDGWLTDDEANDVDTRLLKFRQETQHACGSLGKTFYQLAIALMAKLPYSLAKDKKRAKHDERTELNTYANSFAEKLLVTYGIGHKQCHDGILLLYSVQDHMAVVRWREGLEPYINEAAKFTIERDIERAIHLNGDNLKDGLLEAIELIEHRLPTKHHAPGGSSHTMDILLIVLFLALVGACVAYALHQMQQALYDEGVAVYGEDHAKELATPLQAVTQQTEAIAKTLSDTLTGLIAQE
ncbi:unnamed protein product [Vitrella brassicaformis CCMP3155]|uniref:TPM domain-containing protein n=1 Tax=Vitrella brassicaformis (strain CCMP3155) TaxID=1169540 RepID=A0A0G4F9D7_VITBC|nr:unnamed protein product [Vitrella brassicaformis CCMP3155]|eukprot:CEM08980.1 unnamed protein product [Vitrella brassicaformis CCMP3155]